MDGKLLFEITKLIEHGLKGDRDKIAAYADQIAARLEGEGDTKSAVRLRQILQSQPMRPAAASRATINQIPVPVDGDSRLPVADVSEVTEDVFLCINDGMSVVLDRFLKCYKSAPMLLARGVGISPTLLTYGPPGCGKSQLAKFVAKQVGLPLLTARSDAMISSYLGSTAKNIRKLFDHVAARPCVLFLDEIDAIAKMRDDKHELGELKRVVISLLQNIDALSSEHIVVAASNHPHLLDPAVWRRFAYKLEFKVPDQRQRVEMLTRFFGSYLDDKSVGDLAVLTSGMNGSQLRAIAEESIRGTLLDQPDSQLVSIETATQMTFDQLAHGHVSADPEERLRQLYVKCGDGISGRRMAQMAGVPHTTALRLFTKWKEEHEEESDKNRRAG